MLAININFSILIAGQWLHRRFFSRGGCAVSADEYIFENLHII
jgi:hypothetical protein